MAEIESTERTTPWIGPTALGLVAVLAGAVLTLVYPLSVVGIVPANEYLGSTVNPMIHPFVVYTTVIPGPILLTWGTSAYLDTEYDSLTPRRALGALVPAIMSVCLAGSLFVYEWKWNPPTGIEGEELPPLTLVQILQFELDATRFLALAAVAAVFVGTVAVTRGRRAALATTTLPIGIFAVGLFWGSQQLTLSVLPPILGMIILPCAAGYLAARTGDDPARQ